jgi:hypothetical protein
MNNDSREGKGEKGGECNRGACSNGEAYWFNKSTRKYYCQHCSLLIMRWPENADLLVNERLSAQPAGSAEE